ncbi:response regulator [Evansella tamaricis]|uniref:Response regulator n=1 Tax=Evansella tamaricis TaxID=2069301 RepID=A0ABS6JFQ2_9BACI|nr:response regulator [Evansella tamaricis]MBU9712044.1 response regulator [Evansella tamaricis]
MLKLLIVDDEQIEREGMEAILHKSFPDLLIDQAKNGKIAVEKAKQLNPDIILMDIKMPGMSGLEAIEIIGKDQPMIKFVMVTAFDMFDYARQAIKLGVKDYLLKPSKASEIVETVGRVMKQIEEEREALIKSMIQEEVLQKTLTVVETDVVTQLLFDHVHEVHLDMLVELLDIHSTNEMFVMIVILPSGSEKFYSQVKQIVRETRSGWIGALYGNHLPIIVFRDREKSFRSQAVHLAREILSISYNDPSSNWFVGIGTVCSSLDQIRNSYQDSLLATLVTSVPVKYRFYSDLSIPGDIREFKDRQIEFSDKIRLGHWEQVQEEVMNLILYFEKEGVALIQAQQRILEVLWITSRVLNELGVDSKMPLYPFQTNNYRLLSSETSKLLQSMKNSYLEHYDRLEADTIHQIKHHIIQHSHEDISLEQLGKKVGLSPIYISKMFKEKLGINYIDFLTECRIEKAKKLMADPEKSIKEISFEIGYHEPNYFSKVFKKNCNISPKEYRKMLLGKRD